MSTSPDMTKSQTPSRSRAWNVLASSVRSIGTTNNKVHDSELVTAIKDNENKPSHQADMAQLEQYGALATAENANTNNGGDNISSGLSAYEDQLRSSLSKAVFVGHINTDLDSVAGAMGAAVLFGGTAAISEPFEKLNGEIIYALKNCGLEAPMQFDDLMKDTRHKDGPVCLVDHTEESQMVLTLRSSYTDRVIGVIDHHALAKSFQTKRPIFMDLRPWGSMSTILGYLFVSHRRGLPKPLAVLLMQAILSDTLNLRSVTTTDADRSMVALLHSYGGIGKAAQSMALEIPFEGGLYQDSRIDYLSKKQFQAKTNWVVQLGPYEMTRGDQKDFRSGPWKFGISVLEVTDTTQVMSVASDILSELRLLKKEKALVDDDDDDDEENDSGSAKIDRTLELDFAFLFVVNIVTEISTLLVSGGRELALAKAAFLDNPDINTKDNPVVLHAAAPNIRAPGSTLSPQETAMTLPKGYVSRKAQFVPAFFQAIEEFEYSEKGPMSETTAQDHFEAAYAHGQSGVSDVAEAIQKQIDISKNKKNDMGRRGKMRRHSSLRASFQSNALQATIIQEQLEDEELVSVIQENITKNNGNLYDNEGRVMRIYT